jgi:creatinine amidohydrolase/Fe(II)-dependent formamide hydrolase-like protein
MSERRKEGAGLFENPIEHGLREQGVRAFTVTCPACAAWKADRKHTAPFAGERELARMHHATPEQLAKAQGSRTEGAQ